MAKRRETKSKNVTATVAPKKVQETPTPTPKVEETKEVTAGEALDNALEQELKQVQEEPRRQIDMSLSASYDKKKESFQKEIETWVDDMKKYEEANGLQKPATTTTTTNKIKPLTEMLGEIDEEEPTARQTLDLGDDEEVSGSNSYVKESKELGGLGDDDEEEQESLGAVADEPQPQSEPAITIKSDLVEATVEPEPIEVKSEPEAIKDEPVQEEEVPVEDVIKPEEKKELPPLEPLETGEVAAIQEPIETPNVVNPIPYTGPRLAGARQLAAEDTVLGILVIGALLRQNGGHLKSSHIKYDDGSNLSNTNKVYRSDFIAAALSQHKDIIPYTETGDFEIGAKWMAAREWLTV